jgi:hypothetical protein
MIGIVTETGFTRNGKPYVDIDGVRHYSSRCPQAAGLAKGAQIDYSRSEFTAPDGNRLRGLDNFMVLPVAANPPSAPVRRPPDDSGTAPVNGANVVPWQTLEGNWPGHIPSDVIIGADGAHDAACQCATCGPHGPACWCQKCAK